MASSCFQPTGAVGLVIAGIVIGTAGPSNPSPQASDRSTERAVPALTARQQRAADDYAKLPVSFVENQGQTDARVRYFAQGNGYSFFMTPSEVMLSFAKDSTEQQTPQELALALRFVGGNPKVEPRGSERAPGVINDLRGVDPSMWHTGIAQYRDVVYPDLWPKIDMRLREQSGVLKYEFHVHPGASPSDIQLAYGGADGLALSETGGLQIATPLGMLEDSVPLSYQDIDGVRVPVTSRYVLDDNANANGRFSFDVGGYRRDHELVIDPGVQYTTFLGGNSAETAVEHRCRLRPAMRTSRARHSRPTSRRRPERSIAPVQRRTSPTSS